MLKWIGIIGDVLGIGRDALKRRGEKKAAKAEREFKIAEAETKATVQRILSNVSADNELDIISAQDKRHSVKDDILVYLWLIPVLAAAVVPFITVAHSGAWTELNALIKDSYSSLETLPDFYKYGLLLIFIDVFGFRSFARKLVDAFIVRFTKKVNQSK